MFMNKNIFVLDSKILTHKSFIGYGWMRSLLISILGYFMLILYIGAGKTVLHHNGIQKEGRSFLSLYLRTMV